MRIWLAIRVFFGVLFSSATAARVREVFQELREEGAPRSGEALRKGGGEEALVGERTAEERRPSVAGPKVSGRVAAKAAAEARARTRSEALTLLAALQRESRLVDLIQEPLQEYTDAQIGAAARNVLRDAARTLERFFGLVPVVQAEEGAQVEVPRGFDPNRYRLIGHVVGEPPYRGQLVHPGWEATRCELPTWTGSESAVRVIAPAEVEIGPPPESD